MGSTTPNFHLVKPADSDIVDLDDINGNMDIIDSVMVGLQVPIGTILDYAGITAPSGYLECDGRAISRTEYPVLFAILGTSWGSGDGSTTFNIPNLNGRVAIGSSSTKAFGDYGGSETHTLTTEELPTHAHGLNSHTHSVGAHSHGLNSHTHSVGAHAHGLNSHTHSVGAHAHGLNSHTHSVGAHSHGLNSHTHTINHGHGFTQPSVTGGSHNHSVDISRVSNGTGTTGSGPNYTNSVLLSYDSTWTKHTLTVGAKTHSHTVSGGAVTNHSGSSGAASGSTANSTAFNSGAASGSTANSTAFNSGGPSTTNTANSTAFNSGGPSTTNTADSTAFNSGAASGNTESSGNSSAHSIMQPYAVVKKIIRVA